MNTTVEALIKVFNELGAGINPANEKTIPEIIEQLPKCVVTINKQGKVVGNVKNLITLEAFNKAGEEMMAQVQQMIKEALNGNSNT